MHAVALLLWQGGVRTNLHPCNATMHAAAIVVAVGIQWPRSENAHAYGRGRLALALWMHLP